MNVGRRDLLFGIIIGSIVAAIIFFFLYLNFVPKPQELTYYYKISEQRLENVGCTDNSVCWEGMTCDTLLNKCVAVPGGGQIDENGNIKQIPSKINLPSNQQDCERIGGSWELKLVT